jgi:hypothetical protein
VLAIIDEKQERTDQQISLQVQARQEALKAIKDDWRHEHTALLERVDLTAQSTQELRTAEIAIVAGQIENLAHIMDERFKSIANQFEERDTRSERESRDNKVAVDAAFAAQKEAAAKQEETFSKGIDKSEGATQETINKLTELFRTTNQGLSDKVDDLKQRLSDSEKNLQQRISEVAQVANGSVSEKAGAKGDRAALYATIGVISALLILGMTIVGFLASQH